ncbi:hypothetical protein [Pseudoclavibacter helvolus]|uniref:hypothetical protein n=1 Tax=Pseudoclavibacter helvolus TaxID=255205 RepID=UPI003C72C494
MTMQQGSGVPPGAGRDFPRKVGATAYTPLEAMLDAEVVSWHPPYRAEVRSISEGIRPEARRLFDADTARLLAEDPGRQDLIAPAQWRNGLRILGFLAAAATLAGIVIAAGISPRNQPSVDASVVAVTVGVTSTLALLLVGASMLFPAKMGVPNRLASISLWLGTVGAFASAGALLLRQDTWSPSTPGWLLLTAASGLGLLVLAVVVAIARRPSKHGPAPVTEADLRKLRIRALHTALEHAMESASEAWHRLDEQTQRGLERGRENAVAALLDARGPKFQPEWLRSSAPGSVGLPFAADKAHEILHLGDAQLTARETGGPYGYFVEQSRRAAEEHDHKRG